MIDLKQIQKRVLQNKLNKGFNITNIEMEFCLTHGELAEAFEAFHKQKDNLGEELADVVLYLCGIAEILNIDLGEEILKKIDKNEKRVYIKDGNGFSKIDKI
jgi:NTP pyrophosphatase (non-canonical NTP hydrolase)